MFPVDVVALLHEKLREDRRPPDGLLHASSDLIGSLRHSMLSAAGAPRIDSELVSDVRLMTGTFWHRYVENLLKEQGVRIHTEIDCTPGLPNGWSGTADWLFWHPNFEAWVLGDLKTIKGEGIKWIHREGAKLEHLWQLSAYFWALVDMGFPMVKGFGVLYLPMNDTPDKDDVIEPTLQECEPLDREIVWGQMQARWKLTDEYLAAVLDTGELLNDALAEEQDRVPNVYWNGQRSKFELKLVPHWSAQFCPYPNDLCACNKQGVTKIGEWEWAYNDGDGVYIDGYVPRKGYEDAVLLDEWGEPAVKPALRDVKKREKELNERSAQEAA